MTEKDLRESVKVAVLLGQLTVLGGVGIAAVNEVRELRKLGIDAELVILYRKKGFNSIRDFDAFDIPVVFLSDLLPLFLRINFKFPFFSFFSFFHISSIFWAPFLIKKRKYDVILTHETYSCFCGIASAKFSGAGIASFVWDPVSYILPRVYGKKMPKSLLYLVKKISSAIDRVILKYSDIVITCSSVHEEVLKNLSSEKVAMVKIPPGAEIVNSPNFKRGKVIVSLTKWDIGKNPEFLLKVAKLLKEDFEWIIAGNWVQEDFRKEFIVKIREYGLTKKIKLIGSIFGKEKIELLSKSRVLVHPIIEAFGMFALESAACGCPVILPKKSGVVELFKEGVHGYFPDENETSLFAEKIDILLGDGKKAEEMGMKAWEQAKKYSWKEHALKLKKTLENFKD